MKARIALAAVLACPAAAPGAEVGYTERCTPTCDISTHLVDAAGERNRLTVTGNRANVTIRDGARELKAGEGCAQLDENTVRCPNIRPRLSTGAGDDSVQTEVPLLAELGDGDDVLSGSAGDDTVVGGAGRDLMSGGLGDDLFDPGDRDGDVVDGGTGEDSVTYELRTTGVTVDLARRRGPDGDALVGVENAIGTPKADRLLGDSRSNVLGGAGGRDVLDGRAGPDFLFGSAASVFRCGPGLDRVFSRIRRRPRGCEGLTRRLEA
jgi:Ca2+-binding RTX toxin-like protein